MIVENDEDKESSPFVMLDEATKDVRRAELEQILNIDFLSVAPYSLVNLTENLIPLNLDSTVEDLIDIGK